MWLFGPGLDCKTERTARARAARKLRSEGFHWDRSAGRWTKDSGYGLINFKQRWIVLTTCGRGVKITDKEPPRLRARQAFLAETDD